VRTTGAASTAGHHCPLGHEGAIGIHDVPHGSGEGDAFYRINDGLDAVWLDLCGIRSASTSDLVRVREEVECWVARLEDADNEAAGFASEQDKPIGTGPGQGRSPGRLAGTFWPCGGAP
jgi:hypothetical protein